MNRDFFNTQIVLKVIDIYKKDLKSNGSTCHMPLENLCLVIFSLLRMPVHIVITVTLASTQCRPSSLVSNASVSKGLLPDVPLFLSEIPIKKMEASN